MAIARALVIEDDVDISSMLVETLRTAGFDVTSARDGHEALATFASHEPDLVTIDLTLPHMDGIEVCRQVRERSECYIVIVSARSDEIDRLIGLEVGADDYVLKPFSPRELRARVAALFRRPRTGMVSSGLANGSSPRPTLVLSPGGPHGGEHRGRQRVDLGAGLILDPARREVEIEGSVVDLTRIEYDVLAHLARNRGAVCTREAMVAEIWESDLKNDHHLVDVHVANLRGKLRQHADVPWIHTVRGIGYRLDLAGGNGTARATLATA